MSNKENLIQEIISRSNDDKKIFIEDVIRKEAEVSEIVSMKKKLDKFSNKVNALYEEGIGMLEELTSFRTPQGGFGFKGTNEIKTALPKLEDVSIGIKIALRKGMAKKVEKWDLDDK